ncbi:MAG: hypothetical protein LBL80_01280 [Ruminococcus sp.]|jgi:hypothetical protein|nr:hypothetical protein [Ruminococcus sp.]MDR0974303.1 hypothetical protein [Ruminococcus sp.]
MGQLTDKQTVLIAASIYGDALEAMEEAKKLPNSEHVQKKLRKMMGVLKTVFDGKVPDFGEENE